MTAGTPLPILEVALEVGVAGPLMSDQHALPAKLSPADLAREGFLGVDGALAVLVGTHAQGGVADRLLPDQEASVTFLVVLGEVLVAVGAGIHDGGTILLRTGDFLHDADLVHQVVMQASLAKLVLAVCYSRHLVKLEAGLAELAETAGEGAPYDDVLDVEPFHLLLGGRTSQEAALDCIGQLVGVAVRDGGLVGEADGRKTLALDAVAGTVFDGPLHARGRQVRIITKSQSSIKEMKKHQSLAGSDSSTHSRLFLVKAFPLLRDEQLKPDIPAAPTSPITSRVSSPPRSKY